MHRAIPIRRTAFKRKPARYPSDAALKARREWASEFKECWLCGSHADLQTHEIASRAQSPRGWADERNYLRACAGCNGDFLNWLPEVVQLALKRINDPTRYDRELVNTLRHRAANAITQSDVELWEALLRTRR